MKIVFIKFPIVIMDDGSEVHISRIEGHPQVGAELIQVRDGIYKISAVTSDSECVGGVCPVK